MSTERATPQNQLELWQYLKGLQKLVQLGVELLQQPAMNQTTSGDRSVAFDTTNFYWNIYEQTFGSLLHSPNLGYTREFNHKLFNGIDAGINFYKANFDYQLVLLDIWAKAFDELIRELAASESQGNTVENWRQFLQVWSSSFDRVFAQTFRSEQALAIRGKYLNAAMRYKSHQQQLMEVFLKLNDLPIRSELDEVHHRIYELRKEMKSLKKTLIESQSDALR